MMNKEEFKEMLVCIDNLSNMRDKLEEVDVNLDRLWDEVYCLQDLLIKSSFDNRGIDAYYAWRYEYQKEFPSASGGTIEIHDADDMWDYLIHKDEPITEISNRD